MKIVRIFSRSAMLVVSVTLTTIALPVICLGQGTKSSSTTNTPQTPQPDLPATIAAMVDREISDVEKQVIDAAEAMPEEKFNFSPENLTIPGDDYKGVRTFAVQVKHIAASNYFLWSTLTGDKLPE